ncbi:hypothetical protein EVAR_69685_1 [Eumeta japonica]|uniref:Mariner Mos1 transposase n=1 Tax=Eumeta variegata TaxID=151549 RepID=A0A4C2AFZ8_EUMVA|nr:hypothetical protein EVAR_69685_1 [Eumeta japonica]
MLNLFLHVEAPFLVTVCNRFNHFKRSRTNPTDDVREGRPSTATTEDDISSVRFMIDTGKIVTYQQIRTSLVIVLERFVGGDPNVYDMVTGDKSWTYYYDSETKRKFAQWAFPFKELLTKAKRGRSIGKGC